MIELLHIDCLEYMAGLPDKAFELAIVDPPYGINAPSMAATPCQRKAGSKRLNGGSGKLKNRVLNTSSINWDNKIPDDDYFDELFRVAKKVIIWGGNYFHLPPTRCIIVWDKVQPWENFSQVEMAWTNMDSPARLFKFDNRTGDKIHPTQKPVALYKWLLHNYAKPGDRIIDTHGGSRSLAIACNQMGFNHVSCEIDIDYHNDSVKRYNNAIMQGDLFK